MKSVKEVCKELGMEMHDVENEEGRVLIAYLNSLLTNYYCFFNLGDKCGHFIWCDLDSIAPT